tara:strand:+ start:765 stop:2087 length:1323 start_codon:yes stop_codon:yes gene_type:complete
VGASNGEIGSSPNGNIDNKEKENLEDIYDDIKFGLGDLFATLVDLKTLPHVILLVILSTTLYFFAQISDLGAKFSAIGFISLSFGYAITAYSSKSEIIHGLIRVDRISSESWFKSMILRSFRSWLVPIIFSSVIASIILLITNNDENLGSLLPIGLASLFLIWSIGQGTSFKSSISNWLSNGKSTHNSRERSGGFSAVIFWQLIIVTIISIFIGYGFSSGFEGELSEKIKWIGFVIFSILIQIITIYLIKPSLNEIVSTNGGVRFATRWSVISQVFVTWHFASAWRRLIDDPSPLTMIIEEIILMVITVLLAIWSLASRNVTSGGKLFTKENALFWGLSFGFGYAGSVAMITSLSGSGNLAKTMAIGHIITAITILVLHPIVLRKHSQKIKSNQFEEGNSTSYESNNSEENIVIQNVQAGKNDEEISADLDDDDLDEIEL